MKFLYVPYLPPLHCTTLIIIVIVAAGPTFSRHHQQSIVCIIMLPVAVSQEVQKGKD